MLYMFHGFPTFTERFLSSVSSLPLNIKVDDLCLPLWLTRACTCLRDMSQEIFSCQVSSWHLMRDIKVALCYFTLNMLYLCCSAYMLN